MLLEKKVAIITGGAKGMGRGMAAKFAEEGCAIAVADIALKEAQETIEIVKKKGQEGLACECDVTNLNQVKNTVEQVINKFGKVDILINNAGGMAGTPPIEDIPEELWDKVINLNLKSDFLFCKFVVPLMKAQKYGKIINLSSIGAINPPAHAIAYNTAKAAIIGFTYDLAFALAPYNINVNAILPGPVQTSFYDNFIGSLPEEAKSQFFQGLGKKVPLQRVGTPEDIANAALFLASDQSSWITGITMLVAGGLPLSPNLTPPHRSEK